jgi:hypothetical protein
MDVQQALQKGKRKRTHLITDQRFPSEGTFVDKFANMELPRFKSFMERERDHIFYDEDAGETWVSCFATGFLSSFVTPTASPNFPCCPKTLRDAANVLQIYLYYNHVIDPDTTEVDFRSMLITDACQMGWFATESQAESLVKAINFYNGVNFKGKLLRFVKDFKMFFMVRENMRVEVYKTTEECQISNSRKRSFGIVPLVITSTSSTADILPTGSQQGQLYYFACDLPPNVALYRYSVCIER